MRILSMVLYLYGYLIIARAVMSWFNPNPANPLVQLVYRVTEPVLIPIRRILPDFGGIDFSPLVVMVIIWFLMSVI